MPESSAKSTDNTHRKIANPLQFRFWLEWQLKKDISAYNNNVIYHLKGNLDIPALLCALNDYIHEYNKEFLSHFSEEDTVLSQVFRDDVDVNVEIKDFSDYTHDCQALIDTFIDDFIAAAFDLTQYPLYRYGLIKKSNNEFILVIVVHHIISDMGLINNFLDTISSLYNQYHGGDYHLTVANPADDETLYSSDENIFPQYTEEDENFWLEKFKESKPKTEFITADYQVNEKNSLGLITFNIDSTLNKKLITQAYHLRTTQFCALTGIFAMALSKVSAQKNINLVYPIDLSSKKITRLTGNFVNTLPLSVNCESHFSLADIINATTNLRRETKAHQHSPFSDIINTLRKHGIVNETAYFNTSIGPARFLPKPLSLVNIECESKPSRFYDIENDIKLIYQAENEIYFQLFYNANLYTKEIMQTVCDLVKTLIEQLCHSPDTLLSQIEIIDDVTKEKTLKEHCYGNRLTLPNKTILELFEEQARSNPQKSIIVYKNKHYTYNEVNQLSTQLANVILASKNNLENTSCFIPLVMQRSLYLVVSMLACWKAGFAYVPLNIELPEKELNSLIDELNPSVCLTDEASHSLISASSNIISVDSKLNTIKHTVNVTNTTPSAYAYLLYTSGSTGKPKGVMVGQKALTNHMLWMKNEFNPDDNDVILFKTPAFFDASVWEIFLPLITATKLVIAENNEHKEINQLLRTIKEQQVSIIQFTPSLLELITEFNHWGAHFNNIRMLCCGGEQLTSKLVTTIYESLNCDIINLYGPTEATVDTTYLRINKGDNYQSKSIPIGKAIDNAFVAVVNDDNQLVGANIPGELLISGPGLAGGYYNLDSNKFFNNPFYNSNNMPADYQHAYQTGDIVIWKNDGLLYYIGRKDNQIKYNGIRLEIESLETSIAKIKDIEQVALKLWNIKGVDYLVAYYTSSTNFDIKKALDELLPTSHQPNWFVKLEKLPYLSNSKIARNQLPQPIINPLEKNEKETLSYTESIVQQIWQEVLAVTAAKTDSFFSVGGNSINAMRVNNKLSKYFSQPLLIKYIFEYSTIEKYAAYLDKIKTNIIEPITVDYKTYNKQQNMLSRAQERMLMLEQLNDDHSMVLNMPFVVDISGNLNILYLQQAYQNLLSTFPILRTKIYRHKQSYCQSIDDSDNEINITTIKQEELQSSIRHIIYQPFDLEKAISTRCDLLITAEDKATLIFNQHHIITDAISQSILINHFSHTYNQLCKAIPCVVKPDAKSYSHYASWQNEAIANNTLSHQLDYWNQQLSNLDPCYFPIDNDLVTMNKSENKRLVFPIENELFLAIQTFCREHSTSLFSFIITITMIVLNRYCMNDDISVATIFNNRNDDYLANMIGPLVNTVILRQTIDEETTFKKSLLKISETISLARDNADIPYELVLDKLRQSSNSNNALFNIMVTLQEQFDSDLIALNDTQTTVLDIDYYTVEICPLRLDFYTSDQQLSCHITHSAEYNESSLSLLLSTIKHVIKQVLISPNEQLATIGFTDNQPQQLQQKPCYFYEGVTSVLEQFDKNAEHNANSVAIITEDQQYTYQQLASRANQIANYIHSLQIDDKNSANKNIAVYMQHGFELIATIIGIMKAGYAYVPMSIGIPTQRIDYILSDAKPKLLISQDFLKDDFKQLNNSIDILYVDEISEQYNGTAPYASYDLSQTAYIIYTSGSTGHPKGVVVSHHNLSRLFLSANEHFDFKNSDTWLLFHSFMFDFSVWEIWGALLNVSRLVVLPRARLKDFENLLNYIEKYNINILNQTPSSFIQLMNTAKLLNQYPSALRYIVFGGEKLLPRTIQKHYEALKKTNAAFINMYGITEITVHASFHTVTDEDVLTNNSNIGHPLKDLSFYVLDQYQQLCPRGMPGELYISGDGVTSGYFANESLTNHRYIENKFIDTRSSHQRLYRTGDLVKENDHGDYSYLRRADDQIKLNGYRIELGEINHALKSHPIVKNAATIIKQGNHFDQIISHIVLYKHESIENSSELTQKTESLWKSIYNDIYQQQAVSDSSYKLDFSGWDNSFQKGSIDTSDMEEWLEKTCQRIIHLKPINCIEIGCGSGLLMYNLQPHCEQYYATDLSDQVIQRHQNIVKREKLTNITLFNKDESNTVFSTINHTIDCVIINSVCQYFPQKQYMDDLLHSLISTIKQGHIFIGDVRDYRLHEIFCVEKELNNQNAIVRNNIKQQIDNEKELLFSPNYFLQLADKYPEISQVLILSKKGHAQTEMNRYRYDVIIKLNKPSSSLKNKQKLLWLEQATKSQLLNRLDSAPPIIAIKHIVNPRLKDIVEQYQQLTKTSLQLTSSIVSLQDIKTIAKAHGYTLLTLINNHSNNTFGLLDIILYQDDVSIEDYQLYSDEMDSHAVCNIPLLYRKAITTNIYQFLKARLPSYMLPNKMMLIDRIPLTVNSKIDKRALLEVSNTQDSHINVDHVEASTSLQKQITLIWKKYLEQEVISITDNFFQIGGHSLLAMEIINAINSQFKLSLPLNSIFKSSNIESLARLIESQAKNTQLTITEFSKTIPEDLEYFPLSLQQNRLWFLYKFNKESATAYNTVLSLDISRSVDINCLEKAINYLFKKHAILRTLFVEFDGIPHQFILPQFHLTLAIQKIDQAQYETILSNEFNYFFELGKQPAINIRLLDIENAGLILMINQHHIITDGWSTTLLLNDLNDAYSKFINHQQPAVASDVITYQEYACFQQAHYNPQHFEKSILFWQEKLANAEKLSLPIDFQRPMVMTYEGGLYEFNIEPDKLQLIKAFCSTHQITLFSFLLSALNILFSTLCKQSDISIATATANREAAVLEGIMGFFVNTIIMRNHVDNTQSFANFANQVHQNVADAFYYQDLPFDMLVEHLNVERNTAYNPLYQVMFVLHSQAQRSTQNTENELNINYKMNKQCKATVDINISAHEAREGLQFSIEYYRAIFEENTIKTMFANLLAIINNVLTKSNVRINDLDTSNDSYPSTLVKPITDDVNRTQTSNIRQNTVNNDITNKLKALWANLLGNNNIEHDTIFFNAGGSSLLAIRLMNRINQAFDCELSVSWIYSHNTIMTQAQYFTEPQNHNTDELCYLDFSKTKPLLICLPTALAGAEAYYHLAQKLQDYCDIIAMKQCPLNLLETHLTHLNAVTDYYYQTIKSLLVTERPIIIVGWSVAGIFAHELARLLQQHAHNIQGIIHLDSPEISLINASPDHQTNPLSLPQDLIDYFANLSTENIASYQLREKHCQNMLQHYVPQTSDIPSLFIKAHNALALDSLSHNHEFWQTLYLDVSVHSVSDSHYKLLHAEVVDKIARLISDWLKKNLNQ